MSSNKLSLAILASSLFVIVQAKADFCPLSPFCPNPSLPLQVGPGTVECAENATCTSDGVNFIDPTGILTVTAVNIGKHSTTGVSVAASGRTGGEIQFQAGASTILGTVTASPVPVTNLLKTITINDATSEVTAAGNLHIVNLNFNADGMFSLNEKVNLIGTVTSAAYNTGSLIFKGDSVTGGDISGLKLVSLKAGTLTLNNNIAATSTLIFQCANVLVNQNLLLATNLANNNSLTLGLNTLTVNQYSGSFDSVINISLTQGPIRGNLKILNAHEPAIPTTSTLNLLVVDNDIATSTTPVTIVNASSGTLFVGPIIPNTPLYDFTPDYTTGNQLDIRITRTHTMAEATAHIPALEGISRFFDRIGSTITTSAPNLIPLYNSIRAQQSSYELDVALFSILPDVSGHLRSAAYLGAGRSFNIAFDRMGMDIGCDCILPGCRKRGAWIEATAGEILQNSLECTPGYNAKAAGLVVGSDVNVCPDFMLGWGFAYTAIQTEFQNCLGNLKTNSFQALVYGRYNLGCAWYIDGTLGVATNNYYQNKTVFVPQRDVANSSFNGLQLNGYAEAGYEFFKSCRNRTFFFVPYLAFNYLNLSIDPYNERIYLSTSAPDALKVKYDSIQEVKVGPGFKLAYQTGGRLARFMPYFKLMTLHDFVTDSQNATASFETVSDSTFRVIGPKPSKNSVVSTVGFVWSKDDHTFITLEYDFEHTDNAFKMHSGFLKYRYTWI